MDSDFSNTRKRKIWLAIILHIVTVGLGHCYNGKLRRGFIIFALIQLTGAIFGIAAAIFENFNFLILSIIIPIIIWFWGLVNVISITKKSFGFTPKIYNRWYYYLFYIIITFALVEVLDISTESYTGEFRAVRGSSMENALFTGDVVFYKKSGISSIKNNDVVVIDIEGPGYKGMVKRCIASDGQTVEIINGRVCVDGKLNLPPPTTQLPSSVRDYVSFGQDSLLRDFNMPPLVIPKGCIFVLGDNRNNSRDSRSFGPINQNKVIGKVICVVFSTGAKLENDTRIMGSAIKDFSKIRWNRIGLRIR
jgi:signal peptidase I